MFRSTRCGVVVTVPNLCKAEMTNADTVSPEMCRIVWRVPEPQYIVYWTWWTVNPKTKTNRVCKYQLKLCQKKKYFGHCVDFQ